MKNYNEMAQSVLQRIDEYETAKRKQRKTAAKIGVIAAIICALSITAFAASGSGKYLLDKIGGYFNYTVENPYSGKIENGLTVGYVPEHFEKTGKLDSESDKMITYYYDNTEYVYAAMLDEDGNIKEEILNGTEVHDWEEFEDSHWFEVTKFTSDTEYIFDDESYSIQEITVGERTCLFYVSLPVAENRLVWNEGDYIYRIRGDISKEEMLEIAEHVK